MRTLFSTLIAMVALSFLPDTASAMNPLIRECVNQNLGSFESYPSNGNNVPLCRWGTSLIDAQSLLSFIETPQVVTEAAAVIVNDTSGTDCASVGAPGLMTITEMDDGTKVTPQDICVFSDGSKLALATVQDTSQVSRSSLKYAFRTR